MRKKRTAREDTAKRPSKRRKSWILRLFKWLTWTLLLLVFVLVGVTVWVAGTRSGTEFAWHRLKPLLPDTMQVASVKGRLVGPLHVAGVSLQTQTMKVHVGSIDFDMDLASILHGAIHVKYLDVDGVKYTKTGQAPPEPKKKSGAFTLPKSINLPLAVVVDRVSASNVSIVTAPDAKPLQIDHLKLAGARLDNHQWIIESLSGHGPLFDLQAKASVVPRNGYGLSLHAQAKLRLPNYAPIAATADLSGSLDKIHLSARVDSPYNLALTGVVSDALGTPSLQAQVTAKGVHAQAIAGSLPKLVANARVQASGTLHDLSVALNADVDSADYGQATLAGDLHYSPKAVDFKDIRIGVPATDGQLVANGQLTLQGDKAMNLTVDWSRLAWPLSKKPAYTSDHGQVSLTGTFKDYDLKTSLVWQVVGQTKGKLAANGTGSMKAFDLKSLTVSGGPGDITGNAQVRWAPTLDATAHIQGSHINPGAIVAGIPGDFDLAVDVSASRNGKTLHAKLEKLTAHGTLRHQPLDLKAKAEYLGDHAKIDTLHLVTGATKVDAAGRIGWTPDAKLDMHWSIHSRDLSTLLPELAGSLQTEGSVSGQVKAPNIKAKLSADGVEAFGNKLGQASLNARVDWSGATRSEVELKASRIEASGQKIHDINLNLDGTPAQHHLTLDLNGEQARIDVAMTGSMDKKKYQERFTLRKLALAYQGFAPWKLAAPASGLVSAKGQSIDDACLTSGATRLCLTGSHDAKLSKAHIALSDFDYNYVRKFFPEGMKVRGSVSGQIDARLPSGGSPVAAVDLRTTSGRVDMVNPQGKSVRVLDMRPGHIKAKLAGNGLNADVLLPLAGSDGVSARVSVAQGSGSMLSHALRGQVHISLSSMDFITRLAPEVDTFDGRFSGDMRLGGTLAKPSVLGDMGLDASKIVLVSPGLTLTGVKLSARGSGDAINLHARAESGGGTLSADGKIALAKHGQTVDLTVKGKDFQIAHIPDVTAYVSPDLSIQVAPSSVKVSGSVTIPKASITPRNLPAAGVTTVSPDQVIVTDKPSKAKAVARSVNVDVKVILGDDVHVKGFGLEAGLDGSLRIVQTPGSGPTGSGAINIVNGSYRAYGQNLDIQKGKILFAGGPVSQPGLDIKAARYPNKQVVVGVHVLGTLDHPKLTLFSQPNMSQSEQLSWLLLGRSLDSTNGGQSSLIARAALALGSSKANSVLKGIGDSLGLDNMGIGSSAGAGHDDGEAALMVGKYLSPRLYIGYGLGLFNQVSTVTMRYTLSSHWTLQTESSSEASGGDVIWHFDRK